MVNAHEFLANAKFVTRQEMLKQQQQLQQLQHPAGSGRRVAPPSVVSRRMSPRWIAAATAKMPANNSNHAMMSSTMNNNAMLEFELMDNPTSKLGNNMKEWQRIVAVICLGQGWQFKDWPGPYGQAVSLFDQVYGCYVGLEGDQLPADLQKWNVKRAKLNRDKRSLDSVTHARFWNELEEWMAIFKPELFLSITQTPPGGM
jgi:hypothetical protein